MKRLFCLVIGVMLLISAGCSKSATGDEKTAEIYVKSQGYEITARKGEIEHYIFEKRMLHGGTEARPYQQIWGVQNVKPDEYFGKEIFVYGFTVKNHPLEKIYRQSDGTNVYIMLSEGQVIGGYSFPNADVLGSAYSLDGKTLEEVTGLSLRQYLNKIAGMANTDILYENNNFGFSLLIPQDFLDVVEMKEGSDGLIFVDKEIQAMLPEHIFGVVGRLEIYTKKEYTRGNLKEHEDAYGFRYLGENEKYYFGYAHATDVQVPPEDYQKFIDQFRVLEDRFDQIIQTFKLINPPEINSAAATKASNQYATSSKFVKDRGYKILVNSGANYDLKLPGSFDEIKNGVQIGALLKEKNELSKRQGLDFSNYLGKSVTLFTYGVEDKDDVFANVDLVMDGNIVVGFWVDDHGEPADFNIIVNAYEANN